MPTLASNNIRVIENPPSLGQRTPLAAPLDGFRSKFPRQRKLTPLDIVSKSAPAVDEPKKNDRLGPPANRKLCKISAGCHFRPRAVTDPSHSRTDELMERS